MTATAPCALVLAAGRRRRIQTVAPDGPEPRVVLAGQTVLSGSWKHSQRCGARRYGSCCTTAGSRSWRSWVTEPAADCGWSTPERRRRWHGRRGQAAGGGWERIRSGWPEATTSCSLQHPSGRRSKTRRSRGERDWWAISVTSSLTSRYVRDSYRTFDVERGPAHFEIGADNGNMSWTILYPGRPSRRDWPLRYLRDVSRGRSAAAQAGPGYCARRRGGTAAGGQGGLTWRFSQTSCTTGSTRAP